MAQFFGNDKVGFQPTGATFENYEKLLFTDYERAWDGKRFSEIFKREMNEWGPALMGFQEYRQWLIYG